MEQNIQIDKIIGISAGALFGINYASNQKERALRYNLKYLKDKRYIGISQSFTTGNIINKDFAFYDLPFNPDPFDQNEFEKSHIDFYLAATNIERMVKQSISKLKCFRRNGILQSNLSDALSSHNVWKLMDENIWTEEQLIVFPFEKHKSSVVIKSSLF